MIKGKPGKHNHFNLSTQFRMKKGIKITEFHGEQNIRSKLTKYSPSLCNKMFRT